MRKIKQFFIFLLVTCMVFGCVSCGYPTRAPELSVEDREQIDASGMHYIMYEDVPYYGVSDFWGVGKDKEENEIYVKAMYQSGDFLVSAYKEGICINRYLGWSRRVEIPETIDNKPVIKLGTYPVWDEHYHSYSFYGLFNEKEIKTVQFSSSLKEIVAGTLNNVQDAVAVSEDNPYYASENGMLYNKTKDYLLFIPENAADSTFAVPERVVRITDDVMRCETIKTLVLHKNVEKLNADIHPGISCGRNLQCFEVDANNPYYASEDGVLYNKDKTELLRYPPAKPEKSFVVPDNVEAMGYGAFYSLIYLEIITIKKDIENLETAFQFREEDDDKPYTIIGYQGTAAEQLAREDDFDFVPLD